MCICVYFDESIYTDIFLNTFLLGLKSCDCFHYTWISSEDKNKHSNTGTRISLLSHQNLFRTQRFSLKRKLEKSIKLEKQGLHSTAAVCYLPCGGFCCDLSGFVRLSFCPENIHYKWAQSHCAALPSPFFEVRYYSQDFCKYWSLCTYMFCIYWQGRNLNIYI